MFIFFYLFKCLHISRASIERLKHVMKHPFGFKIVKECHTRTYLQTINIAQNLARIHIAMLKQSRRNLTQASSKQRMRKKSTRLIQILNTVIESRCTTPQHSKLREDIPNPMRLLPARPNLAQRMTIAAVIWSFVRLHETIYICFQQHLF